MVQRSRVQVYGIRLDHVHHDNDPATVIAHCLYAMLPENKTAPIANEQLKLWDPKIGQTSMPSLKPFMIVSTPWNATSISTL